MVNLKSVLEEDPKELQNFAIDFEKFKSLPEASQSAIQSQLEAEGRTPPSEFELMLQPEARPRLRQLLVDEISKAKALEMGAKKKLGKVNPEVLALM